MKFIGLILYIEYQDMVSAGVSENTLKSAVLRESSSWAFIYDPKDNRRVLFSYDDLNQQYKDKLISKYGKPHVYAKNNFDIQPYIKQTDYEFFLDNSIDEKEIPGRCKLAAWFRFIKASSPKQLGYEDADSFYKVVLTYIAAEKVDKFKINNVRVLQKRLKAFKEKGLNSLIHANKGNTHSTKLGPEQKQALEDIYSDHRQLPISLIWVLYNGHAKKTGWAEVSDVCVYNYLKLPEVQMRCNAFRKGLEDWRDDFDPIVSREKPTYPNDMWVMDGTPMEIYYREGNNFNKRMYGFMVVDACSWKIVGYAIGESETGELVAKALKNACTTQGVVPHQLLFDNSSAIKSQMPLIESVARFAIPAKVGNARTKIIEAINGHFNRTILKLHHYHSGGNITSKKDETHANREWLQANRKATPGKEQVIQDLITAITLWDCHTIEAFGNTPNNLYTKPSPRTLPLSDTMRLSLFGTFRKPVQYTNEGLRLFVNGKKIVYWVDDQDFYMKSVGKTFNIKYDPTNLQSIALYDGNTLVKLAETKDLIPMALVDFEGGDRTALNKQLEFKKSVKQKALSRTDAEGYAKAPISIDGIFKDYINAAEADIKQAQIASTVISTEDEDVFGLYDQGLVIGGVFNND